MLTTSSLNVWFSLFSFIRGFHTSFEGAPEDVQVALQPTPGSNKQYGTFQIFSSQVFRFSCVSMSQTYPLLEHWPLTQESTNISNQLVSIHNRNDQEKASSAVVLV